jgi:hypothetical protein
MNSILEKDRAKEVKLWNLDNECCVERALGVYWFIDSDTLGFQINIKSKPMTKRGILSIVSMYNSKTVCYKSMITSISVENIA